MKKFLVVLLSLGLIVAFCAPASALTSDLKFGGAYYVAGVYDNNPKLKGDNTTYSMAMFHQRLRLNPVFTVAEGLTFNAQMDILEKNWGDTRWAPAGGEDKTGSRTGNNAQKIQENIEWELGFVSFMTAVGKFDVGYQSRDAWGTDFANSTNSRPTIAFTTAMGPATFGLFYEKLYEAALNGKVDQDDENYGMFGIYKWKGGEAGLLYKYYLKAQNSGIAVAPYKAKLSLVSPYMKAVFGPVAVEAEVDYVFGKLKLGTPYDAVAGATDIDAQSLGAYVKAQFNMGPAYAGIQLAYVSGKDYDDLTKEAQIVEDGTAWGPAIILGGSDRNDWLDGTGIGDTVTTTNKMQNVIWYNLFGGYAVTPKLNVMVDFTYATSAKTPKVGGVAYVSDKYGMEFDVRANYKIYDNLTYGIGAGYLWTGDFYKGVNANKTIGNDYVVINKLQLNF